MSYRLHITRDAARDLARLPPPIARRIQQRLQELTEAPLDLRRSKPLSGVGDLRSSRVGDWRMLLRVLPPPLATDVPDGEELPEGIVVVEAIRPRGEVYRRL
jgi:mRNA-degrading endonuclease RelE of RelBE toxin-antitoxin system